MEELLEKDYQMLWEELVKRKTFIDRVNFMNAYFLTKIKDDMPIKKAYVIHRHILESKSFSNVFNLANEFFLTERTLRRFFNEYFGMSPKQYLKLVRFEKATKNLFNFGKTNLNDLALDFGYYDLAHFSNDFKFYMKMAPSEFQNKVLKRGIVVN